MSPVLAYVNASDFRAFGRIQQWRPPRWVRLWMLWATRLGDGWLQVATGLGLPARAQGSARRACVVAGGIANGALVFLKRRFRRPRPCEYARLPLYDVKPLEYLPSDHFSFPSGHSMNAFAFATVVALCFPWAAPAAFALAASVAASRVLLGLHFVSDVVVGATLGAAIGKAVFPALLA
jgi:undecaprenyl-diphosphatase